MTRAAPPAQGAGAPESRWPVTLPAWVAVSGAVLVGVLTALQARVNGQLGLYLADGLTAAAISFGSGMLVLIVLSVSSQSGRHGFRRLVGGVRRLSTPWWMLMGGAAGALTVASQGFAVGVIGMSLFTVGVVAGQTVNGLILDRVGYGPGGTVAVTIGRVVSAGLVLLAVVVSLQGGVLDDVPIWMLAMPILAGMGIAWQQATNGRLRQRVGTPLTATLVNFVGGSIILVAAAGIHIAVAGAPRSYPTQPWLYSGGVLGAIYIFLAAALVAQTGVLLLGLGAVAGQLVTALVLDILWPTRAGSGLFIEIATVAIALVSVLVASVPWNRRERTSQ